MLVAMALSVILGAVTMTLVVQISSSANNSTDRAVHSAQARNASRPGAVTYRSPTTRQRRNRASRFEWFTASSLLFYSD